MSANTPTLFVLVGPTAVGKTEVAIHLAEQLGAEIISADSMLVYRGMDIGTAKPTREERRRVPHHMIDVVEPEEEYSVARYANEASARIAEVVSRGKLPMVVGGTGLYVQAVVDGIPLPPAPPDHDFRAAMRDVAKNFGAEELHRRLQAVDPVSAARLHPRDVKRVIRALEIHHVTGNPASSFRSSGGPASYLDQSSRHRYNAVVLGLRREREELYRRIEERADRMLAQGFLDEVERLVQRGCHRGMTSMQGLGYRHLIGYLLGETDLETAVSQWKRDTRRFAKRQLTWFGQDKRIQWITITDKPMSDLLREIMDIADSYLQGKVTEKG